MLNGPDKVWLDPKLGYAVRKRETLYSPGVPAEIRRCMDFEEGPPGFWLPRTIWWERCGPPKAPAPYAGKPLARYVYTVSSLTVNDVPDALFELKIEPGWQVVDTSRLPPIDGVAQPIHYTMPADESDVEEVIATAIDVLDQENAKQRGARVFRWALVGTPVLLIGLLVVSLVWRKWSASRTNDHG